MSALLVDVTPTDSRLAPTPRAEDGCFVYRQYIDGAFVDSDGEGWIDSDNPVTGTVWARVPDGTASDVDRAVGAAPAAVTTRPRAPQRPPPRGARRGRLGALIAHHAAG
ncbi:MAG: aldehyde dehydrogenase family protein, partial [Gluconacetobacter sp.]